MQQALERAGIKSNLGWNYAQDALEMANLMQQVNTISDEPSRVNLKAIQESPQAVISD